jgi:hypothetical protein
LNNHLGRFVDAWNHEQIHAGANLLVAYAHVSVSTSSVRWTTPSGWTLLASLGQGTFRPMIICYRFVDGTETAPVFAVSPSSQARAQVLQYTGGM